MFKHGDAGERSRRSRVQALAATLYTERYRYLCGVARSHGGRGVDPDEAVQEAFALFVASYDPQSGAPPLRWLSLALRRWCWAARDRHWRADRAGVTANGLAAPDEGWWGERRLAVEDGDAASRLDRIDGVSAGMKRLKPDQRRALSLLAYGYSYAEIGEITGFSQTKINRCLAEGRAALREQAS